jgi:endogenous inhibitor of DNA gyrase (YacG/DUF329 family)
MSKCQTCGNCSFWELNWSNPFEGYCAARVEVTDIKFRCDEYRAMKDDDYEETAPAIEASIGGMV